MRASVPTLALALLALAATPAAAGDIIETQDGKFMGNPKLKAPPSSTDDYAASKFSIINETIKEVTYRIAGVGTPQRVATAKVKRIYYDPSSAPQELTRAEDSLGKGAYQQAADLFSRLSSSRLPWAKARGAYGVALAVWFLGDVENAEKLLGEFKASFPDSRWVPEATQYRARALLALGKVAEARKEFESIKTLPGLSEDEKLNADYWITWIDQQVAAQKKDASGLKKALQGYQSLKSKLGGKSTGVAAELRQRCDIGITACQLALGDHAAAKPALQKLIDTATNRVTLAGAHTNMGNVLLAENTGHDKDIYRAALEHFLRVVCLYGQEPGAEDFLAESHYQAGTLFNELRPSGTDAASKEKSSLWRRYARREWSDCVRLFPNTIWAAKSSQSLTSR